MVAKRPAAKIAEEVSDMSVDAEAKVAAEEEAAEGEEDSPAQKDEGEQEEEEEKISEEEALAKREEEITTARRKELKAMAAADLKQLLEKKDLETGNKADMVETLVKHEAKLRAEARAQEAKLRSVVVKKKQELEAMSVPELREKSAEAGAKGQLTKEVRIQLILKHWQENDGVDKALAQMAHDEREKQLVAMDTKALRKRCEAMGVEPFVKEVMVERIVRGERLAGRFARPTFEEETFQEEAPKAKDMVESLLAYEATRKKEQEQKKLQEEALDKKKADLKTLTLEELRKQVTSKGRELGKEKKDDLVDVLMAIAAAEEVVAAKKAKLRALAPEDLKSLIQSKGLEVGKREAMIDTFMAYEDKARAAVAVYAGKIDEALTEKKAELESKSGNELKDMCGSKNLAQGGSKEALIQRLVEDAKTSGDVDTILFGKAREARRVELANKDTAELLKICDSASVDPCVKEVLVERILAYEAQHGVQEPPAKRARK